MTSVEQVFYGQAVPALWNDTIAEHRRAVREATIAAAAALVHEHGVTGVTMSAVADRTGIARGTLYKYFPDVQAVLLAWHERQLQKHLDHLVAVAGLAEPAVRLPAVLTAYARIVQHRHAGDLEALLHSGPHVSDTRDRLRDLLRGLISDAAAQGQARSDVPADELAAYCLHALGAAAFLPEPAAVDRLVDITLTGLRHPPDARSRGRDQSGATNHRPPPT